MAVSICHLPYSINFTHFRLPLFHEIYYLCHPFTKPKKQWTYSNSQNRK